MACSKYQYVKEFETGEVSLLKSTFAVVRVDGKGFSKFTEALHFRKPHDDFGLWLMTRAALRVFELFDDVVLAYGQSDEFSFVFRLHTTLYNRRSEKILSLCVSAFTAAYVRLWLTSDAPKHADEPAFDARVVLYPNLDVLKDYLAWRQVDCHINNLYNYCFWLRVQKRLSQHAEQPPSKAAIDRVRREVHQQVILTDSAQKNEILFTEFDVNYNNLPQLHRKGTVVYRFSGPAPDIARSALSEYDVPKFAGDGEVLVLGKKGKYVVCHDDLISKNFWLKRDHVEKNLLA